MGSPSHFQYLRVTVVVSYIFLQNFAREIVAQPAKIDLSEHFPTMVRCVGVTRLHVLTLNQ